MDEIKLQKLLYFTQKEAIVRTGSPMFAAEFRAWKYGPVILEIHDNYKSGKLHGSLSAEELAKWKDVFDFIFAEYASKRTMSLVGHSHCEQSWIRARKGYGKYDSSDVPMKQSDIYVDAENTKKSREDVEVRRKLHTFLVNHKADSSVGITV